MKSKTSLINGKLLSDTLKRSWVVGFALLLVFFFSITMAATFSARRMMEPERAKDLAVFCDNFFYQKGNAWITDGIIAMFAGAASGIVFYVYMHNKRTVDFFHGQPVRRETLLFTRYLAGLIFFAVPFLLNLLAAYAILLGYGASPAVIGGLVGRFLFGVLAFALLFAFSALSAVLTGNTFAHLQTGFMLCFGLFFVFSVFVWFANSYLKSFSMISENWMYYGSAPILMIKKASEIEFNIGWALLYIALTGITLALTMWLYQRRPSESAGEMFAFPAAEPVYRALLTVLLGSVMGSVFYDSTDSSIAFTVFGTAIGMFIAHIFCQGQFKRALRGMFTNWRPLIITAAAYGLVMAAFIFDVGAYDQYLPELGEVKNVSVQIDGYDERVSIPLEDETTERILMLEYQNFESEAVKNDLLAIARGGIESNNALPRKNAEVPEGVNTIGMTLRYTLQNGKQVQRNYPVIPMNMIGGELGRLMTDKEYCSKEPMLLYDAQHCNYISAYTTGGDDNHFAATRAEKAALLEAYQADLREHGTPVLEAPVAYLECEFLYGRNYVSQTGFIYKNYARTLAIIEGWKDFDLSPVNEEIIKNAVKLDIVYSGYEAILSIDDPETIRKILSSGMLVTNCPSVTLTETIEIHLYTNEDVERIDQAKAAEADMGPVETDGEYISPMDLYYKYGGASYQYRVVKGGMDAIGIQFSA